MNNDKKIALVTGSTKGIGKAIADKFEQKGFIVIRNGSSDQQEISNYIKADLSTDTEIKKIYEKVKVEYGKLDILVNNAAYTKYIPHDELDLLELKVIDRIINLNFKGPLICTQVFNSLLKKSNSGLVINIASIAGINGKGSNIAYCASKAAVINMTKSLARALAPTRVNAISPGYIPTGFVKWQEGDSEKIIDSTPLKKPGSPEEIAEIAWFLYESKFITGENIIADGGLILS